jgi:hypothetical protein
MNSNPGTHNGMAGLEKGIHRSTDRVLFRNGHYFLESERSCGLFVKRTAFAKSGAGFFG